MSKAPTRCMLANLIVWLFVLLPTPALAQGGLQGPGPNQGPTSLTVFETADFSGSGICAACHGNLKDGQGNDVSIDTLSSPPNRLIFGPFVQPLQRPMQPDSGFAPAPGGHVTDSALCGSCHTLYTPSVWADGTPVGFEFPEQTTYLEWAHSSFARSCQDCHLPAAAGAVVISNRPRRLTSRSPFGQHHFVGGNSFMVGLLKTNARALGVTAEPAHFDGTISRTLSQLQQKTALLTVAAMRIGDRLEVTVGVENLAGHKLPSGLPSRRSWLHVSVTDGQGVVVFESGRPRADGSIEGNDADDIDPSTWEPHYDIDLAGATGSMDITVELLYQTVSYPFIVDLAQDETDLVNQFMVMYDPAENAPLRLGVEHASAP